MRPYEVEDWCHGRPLYAWLCENGLEHLDKQLGFHARRARAWRQGGYAYIYTVDKVLVKLGLHLSEIPDEVWCGLPKGERITKPLLAKEKRDRIAALSGSLTPKEIAQLVGCHPKTVRKYARAA